MPRRNPKRSTDGAADDDPPPSKRARGEVTKHTDGTKAEHILAPVPIARMAGRRKPTNAERMRNLADAVKIRDEEIERLKRDRGTAEDRTQSAPRPCSDASRHRAEVAAEKLRMESERSTLELENERLRRDIKLWEKKGRRLQRYLDYWGRLFLTSCERWGHLDKDNDVLVGERNRLAEEVQKLTAENRELGEGCRDLRVYKWRAAVGREAAGKDVAGGSTRGPV